eukprot:g1980.t1
MLESTPPAFALPPRRGPGTAYYDTHEIELRDGGETVALYKVARLSWPRHKHNSSGSLPTESNSGATDDEASPKRVRPECADGGGIRQVITSDPTPTIFSPRFSRGWRYPMFLVASGRSFAKPCDTLHEPYRSLASSSYANCLGTSGTPPAFSLADVMSLLDNTPREGSWSASLLIRVDERIMRKHEGELETISRERAVHQIPATSWRTLRLNLPGNETILNHCNIVSESEDRAWKLSKMPASLQQPPGPSLEAALSNHLCELALEKRDAMDQLERAYGLASRRPAANISCKENASHQHGASTSNTTRQLNEEATRQPSGVPSTKTDQSDTSLLQVANGVSAGPGPPTAPLSMTITKYLTLTKAEVAMGNQVVGQAGQAASDNIFQDSGATSTVITASSIATGLPRLLVKHLADNLIAALGETLVDSTEDSLAYLMTEELTLALTPYLSDHLATALSDDVVVRVPEMVDERPT